MSTNASRIKNGVLWSAVDRVASSGIQLILNLILARLIVPEEYALIAMISIFIALGQTFIDSGFSQALVHKQDRTKDDYSTVFYFNICVAFVFYAIFFAISPLIARFYNNDIFITLTRIVALNLIVSSFSIVQRAVLTIRTDFKTQAIISFSSIILSGVVGVYLAYQGYGVWAMVCQTLLNQLLVAVLLWIVVRWHPSLHFSKDSFKSLFSYGSKLLFSRLINTFCQNCYTLLIGKFYTRDRVAFFNNANQISLYSAGYLNEIVQRALFPIQCENQNDKEKSRFYFFKMMRLSSFIIFPIMVSIIVLARPFVITILTDKWEGMILLMQIIAFGYMWYPVMSTNQMFNVLGRTDLYLKNEVIKKIFFLLIIVVTVRFGVVAMCWGIVLYNFIEMAVTLFMLNKIFPVSILDVIKHLMPSLLLTAGMGIGVLFITSISNNCLLQLILGVVSAPIMYLLLSIVFKSSDLADILSLIKLRK